MYVVKQGQGMFLCVTVSICSTPFCTDPYEDPFTKAKADKKERVVHNEKQHLGNLAQARGLTKSLLSLRSVCH